MALRLRCPSSPSGITSDARPSLRFLQPLDTYVVDAIDDDAHANSNATTFFGIVDDDVAFTLPPPIANDRPRTTSTTSNHSDSESSMRCKRASSTLTSGFYSVGVGAPRATVAVGSIGTAAAGSPSLRFLEHLSMEMTVVPGTSNPRMRKQFAMTVHHSKTKASWRHTRDFDEYQQLQTRLLALMEQGHFCMAECPWLYTFLRRSFPKAPPALALFGLVGNTDKAVEERCAALLRTLVTLQSVVLNPSNHSCEVLTTGVATELVAFLYGETIAQDSELRSPVEVRPWEVASPVAKTVRGFSVSLDRQSENHTNESSLETIDSTENETQDPPVCCSMCALHQQHPDEQVLAHWHARAAKPTLTLPTPKPTLALRNRSSSTDTMVLSQCADAETPTDSFPEPPGTPRSPPPPLIPENAILSPPRLYHRKTLQKKEPRASKRFSLSASTTSMFHSLRQRVRTPSTQGSYVA